MKFTQEQLTKAKAAKSVEELLAFAKENGTELTEDEAKKYFAELHKEGELADEELSNVNGGCGGGGEIAQAEPLYDPKYKVGNAVWFSKNWYTVSAMTWDQTSSAWKYYIVTNSLDKSDSRWVLEGDDDLFDHVPKEYM